MPYKFNPFTNRLDFYEASSGGTVTSVSGTANRITVTNPTTTPVIDIASTYVGQASITTLGTITTGVWNGTVIDAAHGGTGANNAATSGTILRGNGTAFVPTTATYPATAGTSGNVLTSDGTNWVSAAGGGGFSPVAFSAYLSATQSAVTGDGTRFTPVYDGVLSNVGGAYNNATGVFTAPVTGVYMFSYIMCYFNTGAATAFIEAFVSGSPENYDFRATQATAANAFVGTMAQNGTTIVSLNAGTTMQLTAAAYGTTKSVDISGGGLGSYAFTSMFSGFRVA